MLTRIFIITALIVSVILSILGFLILLFFRHYRGVLIPHRWLFCLVGTLFGLIAWWLSDIALSQEKKADRRQSDQLISDLKSNGEKIMVDLNACEIKSSEYTQIIDDSTGAREVAYFFAPYTLQGLVRSPDPNHSRTVDIPQSVFLFRTENPRTGQSECFVSPVIPKDNITLSFYFDRQGNTTLFVDKSDRRRYYFDLNFLDDD